MDYADFGIQILYGKIKTNNMENEIWKIIDGYDELFGISNLGRVYHKRYMVNSRYGKMRWVSSGYIKPTLGKRGYYVVNLFYKNKRKSFYLHRLLAEYFIPKVEGKNFVNHINGIKTDNAINNLEWCTHKENNNHALNTGLNKEIGETHHNTKFTKYDVIFIREQYDNKDLYTVRRLANYFNCSVSTIYKIGKRKQWIIK